MSDRLEKAKASGWKPVSEQEKIPDHIKEWAFQLYAYRCARDSKRVAAYMRAGEYDGENEAFPPTKISDRTIRAWSKRYNWNERLLKENKAMHADLFNVVAAQNVHNSVDAIRVQGEVLHLYKAYIEELAAYRPEYDEKGRVTNPKPEPPLDARTMKALSDFTNGILDRAGHTAWTRRDIDDKPTGPSVSHRDSIGGKTDAELMELANMRIFEIASNVVDVETVRKDET